MNNNTNNNTNNTTTNNMKNNPLLVATNLSKVYLQGKAKIEVFSEFNITVKSGEMLAILGPSGSGKTSLLNILGLLDFPSKGNIFFKGINTNTISESEKDKLRGKEIGFVFQFHHLLPDFTALENVTLPQLINGIEKDVAIKTAKDVLHSVGLSHRLSHFPSMLSGGEQQRVAIARAICLKPSLIIADEPTGNLDAKTAKEVFSLLLNLTEMHGVSVIIATHSKDIAEKVSRQVQFIDGIPKEIYT